MEKLILSVVLVVSLLSCGSYKHSPAWIAEDLRKQGKYQEAITYYKKHFDIKIAQKSVSNSSELNPYFYYLLIGDCQLQLNNSKEALSSYQIALDNNVEKKLVGVKIRALADHLEKNQKIEEALNILQQFRELDSLMFDIDIDKLHKKSLGQNDSEIQ